MIYTDRFSSLDILPNGALETAISHCELQRLFHAWLYLHPDFQTFWLGILMRKAYKESVAWILEYELWAGGYKIMTESYIQNWRKNPSYNGGKILGWEDGEIIGILGFRDVSWQSKSERLFMAWPNTQVWANPNFDEIYNKKWIEKAVKKILEDYIR